MSSGIPPLAEQLICARQALIQVQNELGWLYSSTRRIDGYPNNPEATISVTDRLHHITAGLTCVYMFAILEEFVDPRSSEWNDFLNYLTDDDREKLKAFKHVRNTVAHGFDGSRAQRDVDKFDNVMARPNPSERIQSVVCHDASTIQLGHHCGWECYQFFIRIVDHVLGRAANPHIS